MRFGILLQGRITSWTPSIIEEYKKHFPDSQILVSTWNDENTEGIECEIVNTDSPELAGRSKSNVIFQIIGTNAGLKKMDSDVIMKCRTDQFIHNPKIFQIFQDNAYPEKILVPDIGTYEIIKYRTSDFCQLATKVLLENFWSNIPLYDGSKYEEAGVYLTKNYILNIKKDTSPWKSIVRKYFCVKSFFDDFQIEWEKLNTSDIYQRTLFDAYPKRLIPE